MAVDLVRYGCANNHPLESMIRRIQKLLLLEWEAKVTFYFREENEVANQLAAEADDVGMRLCVIDEPQECVFE